METINVYWEPYAEPMRFLGVAYTSHIPNENDVIEMRFRGNGSNGHKTIELFVVRVYIKAINGTFTLDDEVFPFRESDYEEQPLKVMVRPRAKDFDFLNSLYE